MGGIGPTMGQNHTTQVSSTPQVNHTKKSGVVSKLIKAITSIVKRCLQMEKSEPTFRAQSSVSPKNNFRVVTKTDSQTINRTANQGNQALSPLDGDAAVELTRSPSKELEITLVRNELKSNETPLWVAQMRNHPGQSVAMVRSRLSPSPADVLLESSYRSPRKLGEITPNEWKNNSNLNAIVQHYMNTDSKFIGLGGANLQATINILVDGKILANFFGGMGSPSDLRDNSAGPHGPSYVKFKDTAKLEDGK